MGIRKQPKPVKVFSYSKTHDLAVLCLLGLCRQRGPESKSIQKETLVCLKSFLRVVVSLDSVSSSFGNVENSIQFCAAFVCPFPCGKHGLFPPWFWQTFSQLSFSCLLPCRRCHGWYHSKSRNKSFAAFSSCLLLHLLLYWFCLISDLAHQLIYLFFKENIYFFFPPYQHMSKLKALKWVSGGLGSCPDLTVPQFIIAI